MRESPRMMERKYGSIYVAEFVNFLNDCFSMHMVDTLDKKSLVKFAVSRLALFIVNKNKNFHPFSAHIGIKG